MSDFPAIYRIISRILLSLNSLQVEICIALLELISKNCKSEVTVLYNVQKRIVFFYEYVEIRLYLIYAKFSVYAAELLRVCVKQYDTFICYLN